MTAPSSANRDSLIDFLRAVAAQLIVLHHLSVYGPMPGAVSPEAPELMVWLRDYALMAVQVFLVIGGYLAASTRVDGARALASLALRRYARLAQPFAVALAAAIVCAAVARWLIAHDDTPAAPTLSQIAAHLLLLQDITGVPSLSLGVWYVGIDFQLYVLTLALVCLGSAPATRWVALLTVVSLLALNRDPELELWAPYFFSAYGLGFLARRIAVAEPTLALNMALLLAAVVYGAMLVEWRDRVLVAAAVAALLAAAGHLPVARPWMANRLVAWASRISYALFLIHYPVMLVVGSLVERLWPDHVAAHALGLFAAWATSLAAATLLHELVECRRLPAALRRFKFARA